MTDIIAEIGSSHNGSKDTALRLIEYAAEAGCDYAKFQLFTGDDLWHSSDSRLEATRRLALPVEWLPDLKNHCLDYGIRFLCTPFSLKAVDALEDLGVKAYKISSGDITYLPLIKRVGETVKKVFLSVGAATYAEIDAALSEMPKSDVTLLHCIPGYPVLPAHANLTKILDLTQRYTLRNGGLDREFPVGLSSHLREYYVDAAAVLYRVAVIEKHIDLPGRPGPEGPHSLEPDELTLFVAMVRDIELAMQSHSEFTEEETYARENYRRNQEDWLRPAGRN